MSKAVVFFLLVVAGDVATSQRIKADIGYGSDAAQRHELRTPANTGFASLLFVHGGSLTSGKKTDPDYAALTQNMYDAGIWSPRRRG